jgi:hypothetical protein
MFDTSHTTGRNHSSQSKNMKHKIVAAASAIACALTTQADPIIYKQRPVHWLAIWPYLTQGQRFPAVRAGGPLVQTDLYPPRIEKNGCDGVFIFWAGNKITWISNAAALYGGHISRADQKEVTAERLMQCRKERPAINGL